MKRFGSFKLDTSNQCLWSNGAQVALPPKPFAVLRFLVENPGRLVTHNELLDAVWPETYVQPQVLRTYMLELRKLLGDDAAKPRYIQTLPKRGFCFIAAVEDCAPDQGRNGSEAKNGSGHQTGIELQPFASAPVTEAEVLGRNDELSVLAGLAEQAGSGQRRFVFITGETGIGKTALVDAFFRKLSPHARKARGQCVEGFGGREEYYPVMEALSQLCSAPDGEAACSILARMAPGWLAAERRLADGKAPERLPGDLCAALEELAIEKPLILLFEDLHWSDESTLRLISALARRRAHARLMIVVTYRPDDGDQPLKALKHDLLMRHLCTNLPLAPLARPAIGALLSRELKQEALPQGLGGFVYRHSEGNPLFALAILEHLIAQGHLEQTAASGDPRWEQRATLQEMEASVPDGLAQMIELEIERLTPSEQRLLEAASLVRVAFPSWAVAAALDEDAAETEEACDGLARRLYFVQRAGQDELPDGSCSAFYVFAHALYREVLYRRQSATRRARRHIRIAERLGALFVGRTAIVAREMALHFEAAGDWRRALAALRDAALHAQQREAHAEAVELFEQALRLMPNLSASERSTAETELQSELTLSLKAASASRPVTSEVSIPRVKTTEKA
jgi:predicted ATPase/DNA-binding winged helix-turn-helix (wHTH) protein